jgi:hypothetical protein
MIGLLTCDACGRKVSAEAAKSAGGKSVCPPCYEKARQVVEEKRRKAADEKKTAASKAKMDAAKARAVSRLAERGIDVEDVIERPVILPPSDVIPAVKKKSGARAEDEVGQMLGSAGAVCLAARVAAVVLMLAAGLVAAAGIVGLLSAKGEAGALASAGIVASTVVGMASLVLPALLLWFLGGWVRRFSALFAKHLDAEGQS